MNGTSSLDPGETRLIRGRWEEGLQKSVLCKLNGEIVLILLTMGFVIKICKPI